MVCQGDVKALKAGGKLAYVDVYVHKFLADDVFVVGDKSATTLLNLSSKVESTKCVKQGKCYRLIKPSFSRDRVVLLQRYNP